MDNLRSLVEAGELPIFLDEGGLLDSEGYIREPINGILKEITPNDDAYVFFVSDRRPSDSSAVSIPVVQLSPLQTNETIGRYFSDFSAGLFAYNHVLLGYWRI